MRPCRRRVGGRARRCVCASPRLCPRGRARRRPSPTSLPQPRTRRRRPSHAPRRSAHPSARWLVCAPLSRQASRHFFGGLASGLPGCRRHTSACRQEFHVSLAVRNFEPLAASPFVIAGSAPWGSGNARKHERRSRYHGGCRQVAGCGAGRRYGHRHGTSRTCRTRRVIFGSSGRTRNNARLHIFDGRERSTPRSTGCPRRALVSTPFHHTR